VTHSQSLSRCDSVLINGLRIGHGPLTHLYLLSGDDLPTCEYCGLWHWNTLLDCTSLRETCEKCDTVSFLREFFKSIDNHTIIDFIKETHFIINCNVCYFSFYPHDAVLSTGIAMAILPVCVSHACFISKWLNISSKFLPPDSPIVLVFRLQGVAA